MQILSKSLQVITVFHPRKPRSLVSQSCFVILPVTDFPYDTLTGQNISKCAETMTEADLYSEELKTQSIRDLKLAQMLVEKKTNAEHIAWLCEQSYEKILKHVFSNHLASIGIKVEVIDGKLRRTSLAGQQWRINTLDLSRDISRLFFDLLFGRGGTRQYGKHSGPHRPLISEPGDVWKNFEPSMERMIEQASNAVDASLLISRTIQNYTKENFLHSSSSWNLMPAASGQISPLSQVHGGADAFEYFEKVIRGYLEGVRANFSVQGFDVAAELLARLLKVYYSFVLRAVTMGFWLLPLSEASRYPMPEYHSENLKQFRESEPQLLDYYSVVCLELERLIEASSHFNEAMADLRRFVDAKNTG